MSKKQVSEELLNNNFMISQNPDGLRWHSLNRKWSGLIFFSRDGSVKSVHGHAAIVDRIWRILKVKE